MKKPFLSLVLLTLSVAQAQGSVTTPSTSSPVATPVLSAAQLADQARSLADQARKAYPKNVWSIDWDLWKRSGQAIDQAVSLEPNNPDYLLLQANIYTDVGFWKRAETAWDNYLALKPGDAAARTQAAQVQYNMGYAAYARNDLMSAPQFFAKCSQLQPENVACLSWNARVALESGDYNQASALYAQAAKLAPSDKTVAYFLQLSSNAGKYGPAATAAFSRAYEAIEKGDEARALELYQQATAAAPNFTEAWREQGRLGLKLGHLPAATAAYTALSTLPTVTAADRYNLSIVQEAQQYGLQAVQTFRTAYGKYAAGDKAGAEAGFVAAAQQNPNYAKAWAWLGRSAYERQDYPTAAAAYGKAVELNPTDKTSAYYLKMAQQGK